MKRILVVKVTSLGDVIQAQPVVADIQRAFPGAKVDWVVDDAFAEVTHWNQGIDRVLCAPLRRFKKARRWADLRAITASLAELRAERYDVVLDLHGVYKSAIIAFLARSSRRFGYQSQDLGERGAAFAYNRRFGPRPPCDAWHGMRVSAGEALGYVPEGPPVYNLQLPPTDMPWTDPGDAPLAILFHATSKDEKKWPLEHWVATGQALARRGFRLVLPWGSAAEHKQAQQIAAALPGAIVLPPLSILQVAQLIQMAALVIGVDTGFVHLAHALQKRTVMIFVATSPDHCGISAPFRSISIGDNDRVPSVDEALRAIDYVHSEAVEVDAGAGINTNTGTN
ncbi:lipopolysaccharide heptosyltransferase I [Paraburkholderia bonniea]|uniref:lipopolysaccharide heptosyltransferase I n=1 Tax=Paraburkholderia bonniea TaxID=2152891 RepID=UPI0012915769|nr:lipopolysaccharide heptosyltransferase I [Paraburkholderia bonniea]WJF90944.1 lipopolysaccharide heptosyltransferase I [Paraburkholderia bonniea]WJF94258.1 lipopolysaccharide heptosyltransferase I [Paraburkholderia bonniea]